MKKTLALVIVAAMLLAMVPAFAVAADTVDESTLVDGLTQTSYHMAAKSSAWGDAYKWLMGKQQDNATTSYDGMKRFDTTIADLMYWSYLTNEEPVAATDIVVDNDAIARDHGAPTGDNYMINWNGTLTAERDVTFTVVANKIDNGFMMSIDSTRVFEWWGSSHWFDGNDDRLVANEGTVTLTAGETYYVDAWFLELTGGDVLKVGAYEGDSTEYKSFADLGLTFDLTYNCYHADVDRWGDSNNETHPYVKVFMENAAGKKGDGANGALQGGNGAQCVENNFNYDETIDGLLAASKQIGGEVITPIISTWTPAVNDESYINVYSGYISVPETGYYLFGCTQVDNGFYMEIDGTTVFELWANGTWQDNEVDSWYPTAIKLEAGKLYPMNAAYLELDGGNLLEPVVKFAVAEADVAAAEATNMNDTLTYKTTVPVVTDMMAPDAAEKAITEGTDLVPFVNSETVSCTVGQWDDGTVDRIFDNDLSTKLGASVGGNFSATVTWQTTEPVTVTHYSITTAEDDIAWRRIPTGWSLLGSEDGVTYEVIDYVERGMTGLGCSSNQTATYEVDSPAAYSYYQLYINTCWWGGDAVSFAELDLYNYRGVEESLAGDYYVADDYSGDVYYLLNFDNGTLVIEDLVEEDGADYSGTYTYDGTFANGIVVYDESGAATGITISQNYFGDATFNTTPMGFGQVMHEGQPAEAPSIDLGANQITIKVENFYAPAVEVVYTATEAGTYILSAAEGEENAYVALPDEYGYETVELPYTVELAAGESVTFIISTSANVMQNNGSFEDVIDLVFTLEGAEGGEGGEEGGEGGEEGGENPGTGDAAIILAVVAIIILGAVAVVASKRRHTAK